MTQWRHGLAKGRSSRVALYPPRSAQRERRQRILALAYDFQKPLPAHRGQITNHQTANQPNPERNTR